MKNGRYMTVRILMTVLLTFALTGYLCSAAARTFTQAEVYTEIIEEKDIAQKVHTALAKDFSEAYNTTAIPADVYMNAISTEWIEANMYARTEGWFAYLNDKNAEKNTAEIDFTTLEESITTFFYEYAESIDYEPNDVFDEKLTETIQNAERKITNRMDAFYLETLHKSGITETAQTYLPYLTWLSRGLWALSLILIVALVLLERRENWRRIYWPGCGMFCSGILTAAVPIYILAADKIAGFAIKNPIVYTSITTLLEDGCFGLAQRAVRFAAVGLVMLVTAILLNKKPKIKEA